MEIQKTSTLLVFALLLGGANSFANGIEKRLEEVEKVANDGPFVANWDSLATYEIPEWYQDAKFGIFIHWGVYSVPGFGNEWYPREMYKTESSRKGIHTHHNEAWGGVQETGYKDFIPKFKAEKFNPDDWAKLFKDAGARYVIPVAEHHDGFAMYDSDYSRWTSVKMGPKRDIIGELAESVREQGMHFGVSSHRAENWWFYDHGRTQKSDVQDPEYRDLYGPAVNKETSEEGLTPPNKEFLDDWLLRCAELVDKYEPSVIWFDWWIAQPAFSEHLQEFSAYYYNRGATWDDMVAINYKKFGGESFPDTAGVLDIERGGLSDIRELFWQTDTSVSKSSWGYVTNHDYKEVNTLIDELVDIVSKNGCMLLNIGPKPDGTIPKEEQDMLLEMGDWLQVNGEAIYESRPWVVFGEGPTAVPDGTFSNHAETKRKTFGSKDIRFTQRDGNLYAIVLAWPDKREIEIESFTKDRLEEEISQVTLLGDGKPLKWKQDDDGVRVTLPRKKVGEHAFVLKFEYK